MTRKKNSQPRRPKHVPQRTCVICREKTDKRRLTRIVNNENEGVIVDPTGKKSGRGAYVCDKAACWEKLGRSDVLDKALKVQIDAATKAALLAQFQKKLPEVVGHA